MAVTKTLKDIQLRILVETEEVKNGAAVMKAIYLNKINPSSTADQLYTAGQAVASLQKLTLDSIRTIDTNELTSDE